MAVSNASKNLRRLSAARDPAFTYQMRVLKPAKKTESSEKKSDATTAAPSKATTAAPAATTSAAPAGLRQLSTAAADTVDVAALLKSVVSSDSFNQAMETEMKAEQFPAALGSVSSPKAGKIGCADGSTACGLSDI